MGEPYRIRQAANSKRNKGGSTKMEKSKYYIVIMGVGLSLDRMERAGFNVWLYSDKKVVTYIDLRRYKILFYFKSDDGVLHFNIKELEQ